MLSKSDRPLFAALLTVAFALALNAGVSFAEAPLPDANTHNQVTQSGSEKPSPESREAAATEVIANYTIKLAWLTGVLAAVGIATSGLGLWQILLARKEFAITHRPRLRVRFVAGPTPIGDNSAQIVAHLVNVGDSPATVVSGDLQGVVQDGEIGLVMKMLAPPVWTDQRLEIGQGILLKRIIDGQWSAFDATFTGTIILMGSVEYLDSRGTLRGTSFARDYDPKSGRFSVSRFHPEDEYED